MVVAVVTGISHMERPRRRSDSVTVFPGGVTCHVHVPPRGCRLVSSAFDRVHVPAFLTGASVGVKDGLSRSREAAFRGPDSAATSRVRWKEVEPD